MAVSNVFLHPDETHPVLRSLVGIVLTCSLSSIAGMADAVGFSQAGEFVSFMSGNTTRMGIALSNGDFGRAQRLLMVIVLFVIGNALGAIVARLGGRRHGTMLLLYVGILLALSAGLPAIPGLRDSLGLENLPGAQHLAVEDMTLLSLVLMILAMGALNSAVEVVEGVGLGLTYVTGALSKFGRGLGKFIMGDRRLEFCFQLVPWTGIFIGAVIGNILDGHFGRHALWLPCLMAFTLMICSILLPEDWQSKFI